MQARDKISHSTTDLFTLILVRVVNYVNIYSGPDMRVIIMTIITIVIMLCNIFYSKSGDNRILQG